MSGSERRRCRFGEKEWWRTLNGVQHVTAQGLVNVGYDLAFVRGMGDEAVAVFVMDESVVTIDTDGDMQINSDIKVR